MIFYTKNDKHYAFQVRQAGRGTMAGAQKAGNERTVPVMAAIVCARFWREKIYGFEFLQAKKKLNYFNETIWLNITFIFVYVMF